MREGREINMSGFVHRFEHEPIDPLNEAGQEDYLWYWREEINRRHDEIENGSVKLVPGDEVLKQLAEAPKQWKEELESQRTGPRTESAERAGGEGDLHVPGFGENISEAVQHLTYYDLQHQAQDSLEALDG